jgi:hypothetical protein
VLRRPACQFDENHGRRRRLATGLGRFRPISEQLGQRQAAQAEEARSQKVPTAETVTAREFSSSQFNHGPPPVDSGIAEPEFCINNL